MDGDGRRNSFTLTLEDGRQIDVRLRHNARAKRLILRLDPKTGDAVVTAPPWVRPDEAWAFAEDHEGWLRVRIDRLVERTSLAAEAEIPFRGTPHLIKHRAEARGGVWREADASEIHVTGRPEHVTRRVMDWLRREAKADLGRLVDDAARRLDVRPGRITVRDTKSRWGSCAANGNLSFCWRLILAPDFVREYVVAHEVSHLLEHNHGPRFWRHVAFLTDETDRAKAWLKRHGAELHAIG